MITGYGGTQLRSKMTNSIAKVDNSTLSTGAHTNPAQALSGAVAGLRVQQTSGNPNSTPTLVLRGGTNLDGSGSPLVIIDGAVRESLSDVNPEDIESLEVMKDAGATAIYGARASNGVILVTTKRGSEGHTEINLSAKVGFNFFHSQYEFLNAHDYCIICVRHFIGLRIYGRINRVLGMDLLVMRLYPEHSLTERETDILMKKGMYLMVIRIIQPYGVL